MLCPEAAAAGARVGAWVPGRPRGGREDHGAGGGSGAIPLRTWAPCPVLPQRVGAAAPGRGATPHPACTRNAATGPGGTDGRQRAPDGLRSGGPLSGPSGNALSGRGRPWGPGWPETGAAAGARPVAARLPGHRRPRRPFSFGRGRKAHDRRASWPGGRAPVARRRDAPRAGSESRARAQAPGSPPPCTGGCSRSRARRPEGRA